jgi:hypothetical protein
VQKNQLKGREENPHILTGFMADGLAGSGTLWCHGREVAGYYQVTVGKADYNAAYSES